MDAQRQNDESSPVARYRRSLAALLSEIERPQADDSTLLERSECSARAFEELAHSSDVPEAERQQLLSLVSAALAAAQRQSDELARRTALTSQVLRTTRQTRVEASVGDWCDAAG